MYLPKKLPKISFLYLDHVLRFFEKSNFKDWPDPIESVVYHWGNDKQQFINEVRRKKIDVLIGNIPATAYETFRLIARELPGVRFIPSLDSQFANKSKENVTRLCEKYRLPIPRTEIFYRPKQAQDFLKSSYYPKIIKKSYGPSNYGGYYVHKVDSYQQASKLLARKKYYPVYVQDFVPMAADIRVMLIGHKPVCAFWRRPADGGWLTNTSQGGTMDYQNVPQAVLDLSVATSKAAKAEYWACDIAVGKDGKYRVLECASAFAAFPYIRDWIGQYLVSELSNGHFAKPHIPLYNWEELGKIDSKLLRTMRYITFGRSPAVKFEDCHESFTELDSLNYPIIDDRAPVDEEWPSERWNLQDNFRADVKAPATFKLPELDVSAKEGINTPQPDLSQLTESHLYRFFSEVKGVGPALSQNIINSLGTAGVIDALVNEPQKLTQVKHIKNKKLSNITAHWEYFIRTLQLNRNGSLNNEKSV
ncbi:MAG: hypothetical protein HRU23_15260 [Gammaproteobacteria bacterium]|nr:hypothetical protein [Gammaproteobacteria bacterium]